MFLAVLGGLPDLALQSFNAENDKYHDVKNPPLGVRLDKPLYRLSTPGIAAYTSHGLSSPTGGSEHMEWSDAASSGGTSFLAM